MYLTFVHCVSPLQLHAVQIWLCTITKTVKIRRYRQKLKFETSLSDTFINYLQNNNNKKSKFGAKKLKIFNINLPLFDQNFERPLMVVILFILFKVSHLCITLNI